MSLSRERLQQLEKIEDNVVNVIQCASQSLLELSKEQPSQDYILKTTQEFLQGDIVQYSKVPIDRCSVNIVMEVSECSYEGGWGGVQICKTWMF